MPANYAQRLLHGLENWTDGRPLLPRDVQFQPERIEAPQDQLYDPDERSPYLTSSSQVIAEAQRIHVKTMQDLLAGKKYAILIGLASFENKGDPAISLGTVVFLQRMNIELVFYVSLGTCSEQHAQHALAIAQRYPVEEMVILMSGGGNIIGYRFEDYCRRLAITVFSGYQLVVLSQSIYMWGDETIVESSVKLYCCNKNLTVILRDRQSYAIASRIFNNGTRLLLAPDMAVHNGPFPRYIPPFYDVLWLHREDGEHPGYTQPSSFPAGVSVKRLEWMQIMSLDSKNSLEKAVNVLVNGYEILQQGRVVVTERLHGHILALLLNIPHVLLDNPDRKLSAYYLTWTRGVENCRLTFDSQEAVRLALELLRQYQDQLPQRIAAVDIPEYP